MQLSPKHCNDPPTRTILRGEYTSTAQLASVHSIVPLISTALPVDLTDTSDLDELTESAVTVTLSNDVIVSDDELVMSPAKVIGYFTLWKITEQVEALHDRRHSGATFTDLLEACNLT